MNTRYYDLLELNIDADIDTIFRRFVELADRHHPRHNRGHLHESVDSFKRLCEAFDVLSNPHTRSIYDKRGTTGLNEDLHKGAIEHPLSGKGSFIEHFTFNDLDKSHYTMSTAERLFEQACEKGIPDLRQEEQLLKDPEYFEQLKKDIGQNKNVYVSGYIKESSKIIGDGGKTVEVTKTSKLNPEGNVDTYVKETFIDEKGEKTSKKFGHQSNLMHEEAPKGINN